MGYLCCHDVRSIARLVATAWKMADRSSWSQWSTPSLIAQTFILQEEKRSLGQVESVWLQLPGKWLTAISSTVVSFFYCEEWISV